MAMRHINEDIGLSDDAICVAGAIFGMMQADGKTERLRFGMTQNRPTARCAAALDELEEHGYIEKRVENMGKGPGYYYVLLKPCTIFMRHVVRLSKKNGPIIIAEPIK